MSHCHLGGVCDSFAHSRRAFLVWLLACACGKDMPSRSSAGNAACRVAASPLGTPSARSCYELVARVRPHSVVVPDSRVSRGDFFNTKVSRPSSNTSRFSFAFSCYNSFRRRTWSTFYLQLVFLEGIS